MTAHQFSLHGLVVRLACEDRTVLDLLRARFEQLPTVSNADADLVLHYDFERPPHESPADGRIVYESEESRAVYSPAEDALYAFHRDGPTMRSTAEDGRAEITGSSPANQTWVLTRPLATLALMELVRRRGLYPLHAACLSDGDAGVLVAGPTGSGKSTLTLALLEAGLDFLGDDLVFLRDSDEGLRACGFPDELGLTESVSDAVPGLAADLDLTPAAGWPKARAGLRLLAPGAAVRESCTPAVLVVLSEGARREGLEEIEADEALREILPSILLTDPATCAAHLQALAALTETATTFRVAPRPQLAETTARLLSLLR